MAQGPNINHVDKFERTPLHMAAQSGNVTATQVILEQGVSSHLNINAKSLVSLTNYPVIYFDFILGRRDCSIQSSSERALRNRSSVDPTKWLQPIHHRRERIQRYATSGNKSQIFRHPRDDLRIYGAMQGPIR